MHRLSADLADKVRDLEAFARRASMLQRVTAALTRAVTVQEVADVVTAHSHELFGSTAALLFLFSERCSMLELFSFAGVDAGRVDPYRRVPVDADEPLSQAVRAGEPVWLGNRDELLAAFPHLAAPHLAARHLAGAPLSGVVALPLRDTREIIGGLAFSFYSAAELDAVQRDFFLTVCAQCGLAIERARSFEAERRTNALLQRQQERLALLAHATETLSSSLDSRLALAELTRQVVPTIVDWCAIDEVDPHRQIRRIAVEHRDPHKVNLARELAERYPSHVDDPHGVPAVLRTGRTEWVPDIPDALLVAMARSPEHLALLRSLGLTSYAVVPLIARGRMLGALTLVTEGEHRMTEEDLRFAEELARRAALALENARLYETAEAARAHLHGLFMQAPAAISILRGPELRFELANEPFERWVGRQGLAGRTLREALPELADTSVFATLPQVFASGETFRASELPVRSGASGDPNDGVRHFNVVHQATRDAVGEIDGIATFAFEVSEQVLARRRIEALAEEVARSEAAAREHAETLSTVNELGRVIAAELDQQKVVQAVTDAATTLTDAQFGAFFYNVLDERGARYMLYTISGVPREKFSRFPMPRNTEVFAPTFAGAGVVRSDDITKDPRYGHSAPYHGMPSGHLPVRSYLAVPVTSRSGEVIGGIFLGHENVGVFSERAEALALGLAAQAAVAMDNARLFGDAQRLIKALEGTNRELDQFAYVTSHDLKAPLRGIGSLAEWIEEDLGAALTGDVRRKMDLLRGRVVRMEALIQGILDFSRAARTAGKHEDVDVKKLVHEVIELLAPQPPGRVEIAGELPVLHTARVSLQQVLMNLVSNALKHAGRADARVVISASDGGDDWEFRVRDNGPGIASQYHERVWGIFQTLEARDKVENTGIGLAIVKKIVEGRGGRVAIESAAGQGATFCFTWPKREDTTTTTRM